MAKQRRQNIGRVTAAALALIMCSGYFSDAISLSVPRFSITASAEGVIDLTNAIVTVTGNPTLKVGSLVQTDIETSLTTSVTVNNTELTGEQLSALDIAYTFYSNPSEESIISDWSEITAGTHIYVKATVSDKVNTENTNSSSIKEIGVVEVTGTWDTNFQFDENAGKLSAAPLSPDMKTYDDDEQVSYRFYFKTENGKAEFSGTSCSWKDRAEAVPSVNLPLTFLRLLLGDNLGVQANKTYEIGITAKIAGDIYESSNTYSFAFGGTTGGSLGNPTINNPYYKFEDERKRQWLKIKLKLTTGALRA